MDACSLLPNALDPTTLVTFIFRTSRQVRVVELFGSWDNFHQPYRMHHDRRRGIGFWTGCFRFENIVYDGDGLHWATPRSGGLRQGGTYWYFYRINYDCDAFDPLHPATSSCPLLPGQRVNVLDVPRELIQPPTRCHSANPEAVDARARPPRDLHTLAPADKFARIDAPPLSKLHSRCVSDEALDGRLENPLAPRSTTTTTTTTTTITITSPHSEARSASSRSSHAHSRHRPASQASSVYSRSCSGSTTASAHDAQLPWPSEDPSEERSTSSGTRRRERGRHARPSSSYSSSSSLDPAPEALPPPSPPRPQQRRPRVYSLPNLDIRNRSSDCNSPSRSPVSLRFPPRIHTEQAHLDREPDSASDVISPTFSAMTISSAGLNTPLHLSARNSLRRERDHRSRRGSTCADADEAAAAAAAADCDASDRDPRALVDRLRALALAHPKHPPSASAAASAARRTLVGYSLPTIASESDGSLASPPAQQLCDDEHTRHHDHDHGRNHDYHHIHNHDHTHDYHHTHEHDRAFSDLADLSIRDRSSHLSSSSSPPFSPSPSLLPLDAHAPTITDDIFAELGFLSGSILVT